MEVLKFAVFRSSVRTHMAKGVANFKMGKMKNKMITETEISVLEKRLDFAPTH